jgi:hypothetical protein
LSVLVYGDHPREAPFAELVDDLQARLAAPPAELPIVRHAELVGAFIAASGLAQALADADFEARGEDDHSPRSDAAMDVVMVLAGAVRRSWTGGFGADAVEARTTLARLTAHPLPDRARLKTPEGYAFYALYPEAYFEAAAVYGPNAFDHVIGLRSIGVGLAAMVACAAGREAPITLRPTGHPFRRRLRLANGLKAELTGAPGDRYAVVDEGPGLSGSSFGAVGDLLEQAAPAQVVYFPSHPADLGPQASIEHRRRWARAERAVVDFDALIGRAANSPHRLERWVEDLTGEAVEPIQDLSAGQWRGLHPHSADPPPVWPASERRKYRLRSTTGRWLLKFAGLGAIGEGKLARARALHGAGFSPQPLGFRHGFLVERWIEGASAVDPVRERPRLVARIGAYLAFRASAFPAPRDAGVSVAALMEMARTNLAETDCDDVAEQLATATEAERLERRVRRVFTDNRLHPWEWLQLGDGPILKSDAVDHAEGHDLVGCQDVAWDVAGAAVEFDLCDDEIERICREIGARAQPVDRPLLAALRPAYCAFQIGYWRLAAESQAGDDARRAERRVGYYRSRLPIPTDTSSDRMLSEMST